MVWFDDSGRMQLCEATISGHLIKPPIKMCISTCSGITIVDKKWLVDIVLDVD